MGNKFLILGLLFFVLLIWGKVILNVVSSLDEENHSNMSTQLFSEGQNEYVKIDTLVLTNNDPFASETVQVDQNDYSVDYFNDDEKPVVIEEKEVPSVPYKFVNMGFIKKPTNSSKRGIVKVDKEFFVVAVGDFVRDFKVVGFRGNEIILFSDIYGELVLD
jgi:hypothetical protein